MFLPGDSSVESVFGEGKASGRILRTGPLFCEGRVRATPGLFSVSAWRYHGFGKARRVDGPTGQPLVLFFRTTVFSSLCPFKANMDHRPLTSSWGKIVSGPSG